MIDGMPWYAKQAPLFYQKDLIGLNRLELCLAHDLAPRKESMPNQRSEKVERTCAKTSQNVHHYSNPNPKRIVR